MKSRKKILIVDDEESICEILQYNLHSHGYDADTANSAEQALQMNLSSYDLILLDVMMETMSGFEFAKIIKETPKTADIPIVFCTAKDGEKDTLEGFDLGADDYISKPFSVKEVVARIKSVLRRSDAKNVVGLKPNEDRIIYKELILNKQSRKCLIGNQEVMCTKKEFDLLLLLMSDMGRIFSREEIMTSVWSEDSYVFDRTVDVNITRLRKKLGPYGKNIVTRQGYGYGFEE